MAEFLPNFNDGELWLPSDILPHRPALYCSSKFTYMEDFARPFAVSASIYRRRNPIIPTPPANLAPYLERFRLPVRYSSAGLVPHPRCCRGDVYDVVHGAQGAGLLPPPISHRQLVKPVMQLEGFPEGRTRVLQKQHGGGSLQNRVMESPVSPFQGTGRVGLGGSRGGGVREYGGTGVFLPRNVSSFGSDAIKRNSARNGHVTSRAIPPRNNAAIIQRVAVKQEEEEECHCQQQQQLPLEIGLPPEWIY